jgi:ABC-type multidrug transport system ATPase subunit
MTIDSLLSLIDADDKGVFATSVVVVGVLSGGMRVRISILTALTRME